MAQGLIQVYGMSAEFGLRSYQSQEGLRAYSEHTAEKIDLEVKNVVDQCYREVEQLLTEKKELIEKQGEGFQYKSLIGDRKPPLDFRKGLQ